MYSVTSISSDARQIQTLTTPEGTKVTIEMEYVPLQSGWFFKQIKYGDFVITGMRICTSPNLLHQYINQLPFGFMFTTVANGEPTQQEDFVLKRCNMYILNKDECLQYKSTLQI
jgi:hypothetical protein